MRLSSLMLRRQASAFRKIMLLHTLSPMKRVLTKSSDRKICGVCGGLAEYFDVDPTIVRIAFVLLIFFTALFPAIIAYVLMALIMPE